MIVVLVFAAAAVLFGLRAMRLALLTGPAPRPGGHPESMTADLEPGAEEYLAWLADHHWPADEYLELERDWQTELDASDPDHDAELPERELCPGCHREDDDVWPCRMCGRLLHSGCGHGMRRRRVARPYRTRDMNAEAVIAEWVCTNCSSVVGLDVDHGGQDPAPGY